MYYDCNGYHTNQVVTHINDIARTVYVGDRILEALCNAMMGYDMNAGEAAFLRHTLVYRKVLSW